MTKQKSTKITEAPARESGTPWPRRLGGAAGVVALATLLGLAFNAANPLGVRWHEAPTGPTPAPVPANSAAETPAPAPSDRSSVAAPPPPGAPAHPASPEASSTAPAPPADGPAFITPTVTHWRAVKPLVQAGQAVLVDARKPSAYAAGHIPGAVSLPENSPPEAFAAFRRRYPTNTHLVVYCASQSCSLSFKLAYRLARDYGYTHVQFMTGGYREYQREEGLARAPAIARPVRRAEPPDRDADANPLPISWARAQRWHAELGAIWVDARPAGAYAAGHVPGAVSLPHDSAPERYAALAQCWGPDRPLVVYGARRGDVNTFLTARKLLREYGFHAVGVINEGYQEWRAQQDAKGRDLQP